MCRKNEVGRKMLTVVLSIAMCLAMIGGAVAETFEETVAWDGEYDVIVVGFGAAGAVTSITAADEGAEVLLLEKAPEGKEGGNSRYAAQILLAPTDREKAITYFKAMRGGYDNLTDEMIELIVDGSMAIPQWLMDLGAGELKRYPLIEYPELEGSDGISTVIIGSEMMTGKFWQLVRKNVMDREGKIDVWFESPGMELIQDPQTRIIHGVRVKHEEKLLNIRAKNGVVLACGGFENNEDMVENYTQMPYAYSKGAEYNEGDGIKMAMRVGADLWHMSTLSGPDWNYKADEKEIVYGYTITGATSLSIGDAGFVNGSVILVGSDGTRFTDETVRPRHGHVNNSGTWVSLQIPTPCYMIFDETARLAKSMYPSWSEGNEEELAKGWIVKADTLAELAQSIGVNPEALENTVSLYNEASKTGNDIQFGRSAEKMSAFSQEGPYYAVEMSPSFTNTQGGPRRNVECEIVDVDGNPIPHLYEAGELGSFYPDIYNGGGNLAECVFSGRVAGTNAAKAKEDVQSASVMEGKEPAVEKFAKTKNQVELVEGDLLGSGIGMGGELLVNVAMDGEKIVSVEVLNHHETAGISDRAIEEIPQKIVEAQNTQVDCIAGATVTSKAIMQAVEDALH